MPKTCVHCRSAFYEPKTMMDKADFSAMQRVRVGCSKCGTAVCFSCAATAADRRGESGNCYCPKCSAELGKAGEAGQLGEYFSGWETAAAKQKQREVKKADVKISHRKVFIPEGKRFAFPRKCVICLAPATERKGLSVSKQLEQSVAGGKKVYTVKKNYDIHYCKAHAQRSEVLAGVINKVLVISLAVGVIVSLIFAIAFISEGREEWGMKLLGSAILGGICGFFLFLLLRTLLLVKYPDIWRRGTGAETYGLKAKILASVEKHGSKEPDVEGLELKFSNYEYNRLFCEFNNLSK